MSQTRWMAVSVGVLTVDQTTRYFLWDSFYALVESPLMASFSRAENSGLNAIDTLRFHSVESWHLVLFLMLSTGIMGLLVRWLYQTDPGERLRPLALSIGIGGIAGLIVNKLIDVATINLAFPFYFADVAIVVGLAMTFGHILMAPPTEAPTQKMPDAPPRTDES